MKKVIHTIHKYLSLWFLLPILILNITGVYLAIVEIPSNINQAERREKYDIEGIIAKTPSSFKLETVKISNDLILIGKIKGERVAFKMENNNLIQTQDRSKTTSFMLKLHDNLFLPEGRKVVGIIGVVLLFIVITGFARWFYMIFNKNAPAKFNLKNNAKTAIQLSNKTPFYKHFHTFFGMVFTGFFAVIVFSGISIAYPKQVKQFLGFILGDENKSHKTIKLENQNINNIISLLEKEYNNDCILIQMPSKKNDFKTVFHIKTDLSIPLIAKLDSKTATLTVQNPSNYSIAETVFAYQSYIHKSRIGILWNVMQAISGIFLFLISISGLIFWAKKRANKNKKIILTA